MKSSRYNAERNLNRDDVDDDDGDDNEWEKEKV